MNEFRKASFLFWEYKLSVSFFFGDNDKNLVEIYATSIEQFS